MRSSRIPANRFSVAKAAAAIASVIALTLLGVSGPALADATPTPTPTSSATITPSPAPTAAPTPTPASTATPTPTATSIPLQSTRSFSAASDPTYSISGQVSLGTSGNFAHANEVTVKLYSDGASGSGGRPYPLWATTSTDSSGNYIFSGLPAGYAWYVYFQYVGTGDYDSAWWDSDPAQSYPSTNIFTYAGNAVADETMTAGIGALAGTVTMGSTGLPPAAGTMKVYYTIWATAENPTAYPVDANGNYNIPALQGQYYLRFVYNGSGPYQQSVYDSSGTLSTYTDGNVLNVVTGNQTTTVNLAFPTTGTLSGHVDLGSTSTSAGVGDVTVTLVHWDPVAQAQVDGPTAQTDGSGNYSFSGLLSLDYWPEFHYNGSGPYVAQTPEFSTADDYETTQLWGVGALSFPDEVIPAGYAISGHVYLSDSSHPAGAGDVEVEVDPYSYTGPGIPEFTVLTQADGSYSFRGLPPGGYWLVFHYVGNASYADATPIFDVREYANIVLSADRPGTDATLVVTNRISGTVTADGGAAVANVEVHAERYDATTLADLGGYDTTTASDGSYSFRDLADGDYEVDFVSPDPTYAFQAYEDESIYYFPDLVPVANGDIVAGIDATLHRVSTISGTVTAPGGSASDFTNDDVSAEVEVLDGPSQIWGETGDSVYVSASGGAERYSLTDLAPDDYRILFDYESATFSGEFLSPVIHVTAGTSQTYNATITNHHSLDPIGSLDSAKVVAVGAVTLTGWALDPQTATSIGIAVSVDGAPTANATANTSRPDVGASFPGEGNNHGFAVNLTGLSGGLHTVCVTPLGAPGDDNGAPLCANVTLASGTPFGYIDSVTAASGAATISGWMIDPDTASAISVNVLVDGTPETTVVASSAHAGVGAAYPGYGDNHGYTTNVTELSGGSHSVCVVGVNVGLGSNSAPTCRTVVVPSGSPFGSLDSVVAGSTSVTVTGWMIDPDAANSVSVNVTADGTTVATVTANALRTDVGAAFPGYGNNHGYVAAISGLGAGSHSICVVGVNVGPGANSAPTCRTIVLATPSGTPFGSLDSVVAASGSATATGWMIDPDTTDPVSVNITVDGTPTTTVVANLLRTDVGAAFPGSGNNHGYSTSVTGLSGGSHLVCVVGVNVGSGVNSAQSCRTVTVPSGSPFGSFDSAGTGPGSATVSGWMIDPDTANPVSVAVTVDGTTAVTVVANSLRTDVGAAYPGYGNNHGYSTNVTGLTGGSHSLCVVGLNVGPGVNSAPSCRTVSVPTGSPFGYVDAATAGPGSLTVSGWMIDPDTAGPASVNVTVDGVLQSTAVASATHGGIGAAYPGYGDDHGYTVTETGITGGSHTLCVIGVNVGPGGNSAPSCFTLVVLSGSPFGYVDSVVTAPGAIFVFGWMIDPDTAGAISVNVTLDGTLADTEVASLVHGGIGAAFPGYGDDHGYDAILNGVSAGFHTVCVSGVNVGPGANSTPVCETIKVAAG